jgi:hypothetical protein
MTWLTIVYGYQAEKKPGRSGRRYKTVCRCGNEHDVSYENIVYERVIACRKCAKKARAEEDRRIQ